MSMTIEEIEREINHLQTEEKTILLRHLISELDEAVDDNADEAWRIEVQKRHDELIQGKAETIPSDEVFKTARERLKNAGKIPS